MSATGHPGGTNAEEVPVELAEAGVYSTPTDGFEHGLVVLAMGRPYWLVESDSGYRLLVEPQVLASAREQLECYDRESVGWPPPSAADDSPSRRVERFTPLVWALAVLVVYRFQIDSAGSFEEAGALDSHAVFDRGEWWRPVTALFLHADLGHLLANVISGYFVFSAVLSTIGRGRGWLCLAVAAIAGNCAVAGLNYPGPYRSLGASTAIFAGLGLLTGRAVRVLRTRSGGHPWRAVLVPLAAGVALLGLFGAGGLHTDVVAHANGFGAGLVLGATIPANHE
jgi:membrane associated rhomboid family serine protease